LIVVKCKDIEEVMSKLVVHVAEQVGAIPVLKIHEFVLTTMDDEEIDISKAIDSIKDFLKVIEKENNFAVTAMNQTILITSLDGKPLKITNDSNSGSFFTCQHCGRISFFEADHRDHEKLHYISGA